MKKFMILPVTTKNDCDVLCYAVEVNNEVKEHLEMLTQKRKEFGYDFLDSVGMGDVMGINTYLVQGGGYLSQDTKTRKTFDKINDTIEDSNITYIELEDSEIEDLQQLDRASLTKMFVCDGGNFYFGEFDFEYDYVESFMFDIRDLV